jgi:hypothetical protein
MGPHQSVLGSNALREDRRKMIALNLLMGASVASIVETFRIERKMIQRVAAEHGLIRVIIYVKKED